ncbi:MAG: DUF456 domain-containing protein [Treponema sp.]|nr:DUF456 domain-containing protein [Treponema sp.]MBP5753816.1 DUF456 domain-containing protein [Treponema sp.]MBR4005133.1 DUF456 domain-containing protein [Treponema sp.]
MLVKDITLIAIGVLLIVVGLIGCIIPGVPGTPLCWGALLLAYFTTKSSITWVSILILGIITVIVEILDFFIPAMLTKASGGSKAGSIGSTIGVFAGLLMGSIVTILIGPFIGALIGELIHDSSDLKKVFKSAWFSFLGFLTGSGIRLVVSTVILIVWVKSFF